MQLAGLFWILILCCIHPCSVEPAGISGVQLIQLSPQQTPCPGEEVVYVCTVPGNRLRWRISVETGDRILESTSAEVDQNGFRSTAGVFDAANNCFNSTLTFSAQNGTSIICLNRDQSMSEPVTVTVQAPPAAPRTPSVTFLIQKQQFTITWNEPPLNMGGTVDAYFVNISGPNDLCGDVNTLQRVGSSSTRSYTCSGWMMPTGQKYIFTVQAANCGGIQRGPESEPVTVCLHAPNPPTLTATPLYDSFGVLLEIESQATEGSPVTIADGVDSSPTEYIFSYGTGPPISVITGSTPQCISSSCQHTFRATSSQVQQYTISAAARNVVGMGNASTPVSVDSTNMVFNVTVDVRALEVTCQFLNGPVTSTTCTIQYGTDPTYMNLTNTDSSTGTNVNTVTVPLSTALLASTLYYYVVSSMGVRMQGTFYSGCTLADLGVVDTTPDERCIGLQNSAQFTGGVVCYSGVIPGSLAVYVCNSTHHLEGPRFRECQSNGNWSGSVPQCVAGPISTDPGLATTVNCLSTGAAVGISITIFLVSFSAGVMLALLVTYCCCVRGIGESSSRQPHLFSSEGPVDTLEMKENPSYAPVGH